MRPRPLLIAAAAVVLAAAGWFLFLRGGPEEDLWIEPTEISFGRVPHGDEAVRTLKIANHGSRDIFISDVIANCSCFQVSRNYARMLHPGATTEVTVALRTVNVPPEPLRGKRLTVITSETRKDVPLHGDIVEIKRISPVRIDLGEVPIAKAGEKGPWLVEVRPGPTFQVKLLSARVEPPENFVVETAPAGGGTDVTVRVASDAKGAGSFHATLFLTTEARDEAGRVRTFTDKVFLDGTWM